MAYIPKASKFLIYFGNDVVQVDLDSSFLSSPETAHEHATAILQSVGLAPSFFEPRGPTASTLPDALVILGAYGHGLISQLAFGSKIELIQTVLPDSMLIVGSYCGI